MRVMEVREPFGLDALALAERPDPEPGPGEVVVRVRACALNYRDLMVVNGVPPFRPASPPRIPVSDAVGAVVALGAGVTRVKAGDRVAPIFYPKWADGGITPERASGAPGGAGGDGFLAELVRLPAEGVVRVPGHLSDEEAATLPTAGVTAWNAVVEAGGVRPGDTVATLGTGGVSMFALQFARLLGARVVVTSSSDDKLARAVALGADAGVNYGKTADWPSAVRERTSGRGADLVVDTAGALGAALAATRTGGAVVFVGFLAGLRAEMDLGAFMSKAARIQAVDVGSRRMFEEMNEAIALHRLRPPVDRVFPFAEAREALAYLAGGRHFGKVCLRF